MPLDRFQELGKSKGGDLVEYTKESINASMIDGLCVAEMHLEALTLMVDLKYTKAIYTVRLYRLPDQPVQDY